MRVPSTRFLFVGAIVTTMLCATLPAAAQTTPKKTLLALSKHDHMLAIVDPASLRVIARAPWVPTRMRSSHQKTERLPTSPFMAEDAITHSL